MISFISIGSNIGDRIQNINTALDLISLKNKIIAVSNLYITKPMYYLNQPYFINAVIKIKTKMNPVSLLDYLNDIEKKLGRQRMFRNSPRRIDLDIIYCDNIILDSNKLKIPHPKIYERAFVLKPLSELSDDFIDPIKNKTIKTLLSQIKLNQNDIDMLKIPQNFSNILAFLNSISPRKKNDLKTDYIKKTLKVLNNPQSRIGKIIHITGSCGKTSTAKYINDILVSSGYRVGLYTSPHVFNVRERIMINSQMISKSNFYNNIIKIISKSKIIHSPFEYITLVALCEFGNKKLDFSIIEVGMGGRDDATNVFNKSYSVFTTITGEHKQYLGKTVKEIALNKSGIIKKNSKVFVSGYNRKEIINLLKQEAKRKKSKFYFFPKKEINDFDSVNLDFARFVLSKISSVKKYKIKNFGCRNQIIKYKGIKILVDGAHTPISLKMLLKSLKRKYKICFCGFMQDKEIKKMLEIIKKEGFEIYMAPSYSPRSFDPYKFKEYGIAFKKLSYGLNHILKIKKDLIVCGSLYFCSDVVNMINKRRITYFRELI